MTMAQIKTKTMHLKKAGVIVMEFIDDYGIEVSCMVNGQKRIIGYISAEDKIKEMRIISCNTFQSANGKATVVCTDVFNNLFKTVHHHIVEETNDAVSTTTTRRHVLANR